MEAQDTTQVQIIQPTIGRKVWFWPTEMHARTGTNVHDGQPCDATVIYVHDDGHVNLRVTDHIGQVHTYTHVKLAQGITPETADDAPRGCATWMPYQAKQAAKATEPTTLVVASEAPAENTQPATETEPEKA
jgi:hypothetical protein